jgi:hypothetical protein
MPRRENAKGRENDVLSLAVLELAATEHAEPVAAPATGGRGMEQRRIDSLQERDDIVEAMLIQDPLVPIRSRHHERKGASARDDFRPEMGGVEEHHADRGLPRDPMIQTTWPEVDIAQYRAFQPTTRRAERRQDVPQRLRQGDEGAQRAELQRIDGELGRDNRDGAHQLDIRVIRPLQRQIKRVDAPAEEA